MCMKYLLVLILCCGSCRHYSSYTASCPATTTSFVLCIDDYTITTIFLIDCTVGKELEAGFSCVFFFCFITIKGLNYSRLIQNQHTEVHH